MRNKGFTLIELVIVIVILGILAATAAPKFLDLSGDARASVIKGVEGSINSAADIVHAKALIEGVVNGTLEDGSTIVAGGWPTAATMVNLIELSTDSGISSAVDGTAVTFDHEDANSIVANTDLCEVVYTQSANTETRPAVVSNVKGC